MMIAAAIQEKRLLSFSYDGYDRVVEPHTYGIDSRGHETLCAFQVFGGSSSGEYRGWKQFHINDMHNLTTLQDTFASARPGYKRGDSRFTRIYAQL